MRRNQSNSWIYTIAYNLQQSKLEDILANVKGAQLFTKLELKSALHQIELTSESRKTFQSETVIKHFTWLIGANSASEGLQHALRNV